MYVVTLHVCSLWIWPAAGRRARRAVRTAATPPLHVAFFALCSDRQSRLRSLALNPRAILHM